VVRSKDVAHCDKFFSQFKMVVYLSIKCHPDGFIFVRQGLGGRSAQVQNRETAVPESDLPIFRQPEAMPIRTTVGHGVPHGYQHPGIDLNPGRIGKGTNYATHKEFPTLSVQINDKSITIAESSILDGGIVQGILPVTASIPATQSATHESKFDSLNIFREPMLNPFAVGPHGNHKEC